MFKAPREYPGNYLGRSIIELRGNPYPSLVPEGTKNRLLLHNVLLDEARKDHIREKRRTIEENLQKSEVKPEMKVEWIGRTKCSCFNRGIIRQ